MRKSLLFVSPVAALVLSLAACSGSDRRSGFEEEREVDETRPHGFDQVDAGQVEEKGCSESQTEIARIPVVIQFVVDRSGSMQGNKWQAQSDALRAAFEDMHKIGDPATFVGLSFFESNVGPSVPPGPIAEASHYQSLTGLVSSTSTTGATASEAALQAGYQVLETFAPPASSGLDPNQTKRALVFVSDGEPNGGDAEKTRCQDLAMEKFTPPPPTDPILTFAIGIGPFPATSYGYDPAFMGRLAIHGGTADPLTCDPETTNEDYVCHYQVTPGADVSSTKQKLIDAISAISALTASCEFTFTKSPDADLGKTKVFVTDADGNETEIPRDPENGWSFDNPESPTKVILNGDACSATNGTMAGRVDVVLGCIDAK